MDYFISEEDAIHQLKLSLRTQNKSTMTEFLINFNGSNNSSLDASDVVLLHNWTLKYNDIFDNSSTINEWKICVLVCYTLIFLVSLFGNSLVCHIVFWNAAARSTTNIYIGSLSISDLLMTILNIPLQLTQILCRDWPLNRFLCRSMPFFQGLSVNVSSFTIACIALDRHQVIAHPLKPRPMMTSILLKLAFIWLMAALASAPYPTIANVEEEFTYRKMTRCRLIYPEPQIQIRFSLTLFTMIVQYLVPLAIAGFNYYKICIIIWNRRSIGIMSERQRNQRYTAKWKTIKMLIVVLFVFAVCWLPIHAYHLYQDLRGVVGIRKHSPEIVLLCHCIAMSSICYNPFVYCWLNEKFQAKAKILLCCKFSNSKAWRFTENGSQTKLRKFSSKALSMSMSTELKYSHRLKTSRNKTLKKCLESKRAMEQEKITLKTFIGMPTKINEDIETI